MSHPLPPPGTRIRIPWLPDRPAVRVLGYDDLGGLLVRHPYEPGRELTIYVFEACNKCENDPGYFMGERI